MSKLEQDQKAAPTVNGNAATPQVNGSLPHKPPKIPSTQPTEAMAQDKAAWGGFCEIESDPAFFNVMLREFGISGIRVQEVYSRNYEDFFEMAQPVHGLIFLFRYHEDPDENQENDCPKHIWFANQTQEQLCATLAMLNILNNVPGADLGPHLQSFKEFTQDFTPALKGDAVCNFQFMKTIHNSFARKIDMLDTDLRLKNKYDGAKSSKTPNKRRKFPKADDADEFYEPGMHYIALVPIGGQVWKLDGMDRQPSMVDMYTGTEIEWLKVALNDIEKRIAQYQDSVYEFGLLAVTHDPTVDYQERLVLNIKKLNTVHARLDGYGDGWSMLESDEDRNLMRSTITGAAAPLYDITREMIDEAAIDDDFLSKLDTASPEDMLKMRLDLAKSQEVFRRDLQEALDSTRSDQERADQHRFDYGPLLTTWLRMLAEQEDVLEEIVNDVKG
ncbi:MAG: hypothetical protein M1828_003598 [Chrysothrix sp. TS-e1954]|nr:MAG: hypothetical protein M1828_003598 [Chrysothrix sp. TS-e1954]